MSQRHARMLTMLGTGLLTMLILACASGGMDAPVAPHAARWACPSPLPQPYGEAGPVKETIHHTRPITEGGDWDEDIYYEPWEQEYADLGGPPFPSPTPYGFDGTTFIFGQRVELAPFHLRVTANAGPKVSLPVAESEAVQLYTVQLTWHSPLATAVPVDYAAQLRLRTITLADGSERTDSGWAPSGRALEAAEQDDLPATISPGESTVTIPILAPPGTPKVVEFSLPTADNQLLTTPGAPNPELQRPAQRWLTIAWVNSGFDYFGAPPCGDPGALTAWDSGESVPIGAAAPSGVARVVTIALNQLGKPYVWGAKGPETFDCSGLMTWSYAQIGVAIPVGTAGQWPQLRPTTAAQLQDGDLAFFDTDGAAGDQITHVGMVFRRDGHWRLVHAANPALGVREDSLESTYYQQRLMGYRTAR